MSENICIRLQADAKQIMDCRASIEEIDPSFNSLSEVLSLAGNMVRLKIIYLLNREGRLCVCDLSDILQMNVSAISQHLRKLKDRNLIFSTKEGQIIFYSIREERHLLLSSLLKMLDNKKILVEDHEEQ
jgi:ArsR family transcriptional regulator, lead/cadmium/zinc/bismuth-responsive transcriptional repressor